MRRSHARLAIHAALLAALAIAFASPAAARHGWPRVVAPPAHVYGGFGYGQGILHRHPHHYLPPRYAHGYFNGPRYDVGPRYRHFGHKFRHGRLHDRHRGYYRRYRGLRPYGGSSLFFRFGR